MVVLEKMYTITAILGKQLYKPSWDFWSQYTSLGDSPGLKPGQLLKKKKKKKKKEKKRKSPGGKDSGQESQT